MVDLTVLSLHVPLHAEHFLERLFIAMGNFELLPDLPNPHTSPTPIHGHTQLHIRTYIHALTHIHAYILLPYRDVDTPTYIDPHTYTDILQAPALDTYK